MPWESQRDSQTQFFGAESPLGQARIQGRAVAVSDYDTAFALCPHQPPAATLSAFICPILQSSRCIGCLCIVSTQPIRYLQQHYELISYYVDLTVLSFEQHDLYELSDIDLGVMPPNTLQQPYLAHFSQRVTQCMLQSVRNNQPITRPQAEELVWQQFEEEFLNLPFDAHP